MMLDSPQLHSRVIFYLPLMLAYHDKEFIESEHGRPIRIMSEFLASKAIIDDNKIEKNIVIYGSARTPENSRYYREAQELAKKLGEWLKGQPQKYAICTGGGPGIMEAGNRGAREARVPSLGFCIELPFEQSTNPFVDKELEIQFHYFFLRKFWFLSQSAAIIAFPGGWGTFDELFESLTMLQNGKTKKVPVVLFGKEFWKGIVNWQKFVDDGLINSADMELLHFSDTVDEAVEYTIKRL